MLRPLLALLAGALLGACSVVYIRGDAPQLRATNGGMPLCVISCENSSDAGAAGAASAPAKPSPKANPLPQ